MGKSKSLQSSTPQNHTKAIIQASMRSVSELKKIWCVVEASNDKEVYDTKLSDVVILTSEDENGDKGYHNVESIVSEIQIEFPKAKIFGIRDSDYTRFVSSYSCPKNVFLTDEHGIEMMMLSAPSVKEALMADESKLFNTLQESADAVRPLGYLRIYNEVNDTKCRFAKKIKASSAWDFEKRVLREDKDEIWLNKFLQNCPVPVTRSQVENFITSLELESYPNSIICRGHDVLTLSSQMMIDTTTYSEERIFKKIAREYSQEDFDATALGTQIHSFLMSC